MRIALFDTRRFDRAAFEDANARYGHTLKFFEPRLTIETASLAQGFEAVCSFVNDRLDRATLTTLAAGGVRLVLLRSAGFNHVDLEATAALGLPVLRVPEYSPHAVAEHTVALVLALDRKIHRAHARVREGNFSLDGLVGFDLYGKTFGVLGLGKIGQVVARIMRGFGCRVLVFDQVRDEALAQELGLEFVSLPELYREADILSLHVPLTPATRHLIDAHAIAQMKPGVMLINTSRGALIDSVALINGLKRGHIGYAGLDVYEEEEAVFFRDLSNEVLQDDVLARLLTFPNVLVTAHQAFLTREALAAIADTTLSNATAFEKGAPLVNEVRGSQVLRPPTP
jgi:D-lactate dehydrogenase